MSESGPGTKRVHLVFPEELWDQVGVAADAEGMSKNRYVAAAVEQRLNPPLLVVSDGVFTRVELEQMVTSPGAVEALPITNCEHPVEARAVFGAMVRCGVCGERIS